MNCTCGELTALNVVHRSDGPCYIPEPQRQWVGLTNDEVEECKFKALNGTGWSMDVNLDDYAKEIEAKLKEKNT